MRSIAIRVSALAAVLATTTPAFANQIQAEAPVIQFVAGTGEASSQALPTPVLVQAPIQSLAPNADQGDVSADMMKMADKLSDPKMQAGVANMMERMTQTMMSMPVGKFVAAIEKAAPGAIKSKKRIREDATIADLAGRDADRLSGDIAKGTQQMMGMLSGFAAAFATMIPEFEKMGDELEKGFEGAKASHK
jgi:hypothetical protein